MADDTPAQRILNSDLSQSMSDLGYDEAGQENMRNMLKRPQQMLFAPAQALLAGEGASGAANQVLEAAKGKTHVTGGDLMGQIQDNYSIKNPAALAGLAAAGAGLDVFGDPVQHGMGAMSKAGNVPMSGRIADVAKSQGAYDTANAILKSGNPGMLNAVKEASDAELNQSIAGLRNSVRREVPPSRAVIVAPEIGNNMMAPGVTGVVTGSNTIAPRGIQPANMSRVSLRAPEDSLADKLSTAFANNQKVGFSPAVSTQDQARAIRALEVLKKRAIK